MLYRAIGITGGSLMSGLDIVFVHLQETAGTWAFEIQHADCIPYSTEWIDKLNSAAELSARDYQLLHSAYGHYIGVLVNRFIDERNLHHQVHLVAVHGHTVFHIPLQKMIAQLGDGAAIAAITGLPVVSDLRAMDIALGGLGTSVEAIGEKLLLPAYNCFLDLDDIASLSFHTADKSIGIDVCAAIQVLKLLIKPAGKAYTDAGEIAAAGHADTGLLNELNRLEYYQQNFPKSLPGDFSSSIVYPLIQKYQLRVEDAVRTYTGHIAEQIKNAVTMLASSTSVTGSKLLVTGKGALNDFMMELIRGQLQPFSMEIVVPDEQLVNYKEALVIALMGVLRWREEYNVLASSTGAARNSINGALWLGGEA